MITDNSVGGGCVSGSVDGGSGRGEGPSTTAKPRDRNEKRNWFLSLSRRRKFQSQSQNSSSSSSSVSTTSFQQQQEQDQDINIEPPTTGNVAESTKPTNIFGIPVAITESSDSAQQQSQRKRKDEKNVFQRIKKKMGIHFLLRQKNVIKVAAPVVADSDASGEFSLSLHHPTEAAPVSSINLDPPEMILFTQHFRGYIARKWLEQDSGPNRVMYKACYEMLSQVWYWGEISRRDAQKQLTDKPTGSFLVRDSETSGSQFTLSFRILNVTLHYRLEYRENFWHFEELQYESIVEMIEDILYRCTNDNFVCFVKVPNEMQPPFPVILKYPLSRYLKILSLQDLCRRVIQRHIDSEEIATLPIPPKLHEYLGERRELVFQS